VNLYFLVEGSSTEKKAYPRWIAHAFGGLEQAYRIEDLAGGHFLVMSGNGYPQYLHMIDAALEEIAWHGAVDHLFICVDAEDMAPRDKFGEIRRRILESPSPEPASWHVLVQNCCFETWLLGHSGMMPRNPSSRYLFDLKSRYDVSQRDPEYLNAPRNYSKSRARYHYRYLVEMLREQGLHYSKADPAPALEEGYFRALCLRHETTRHIASFGRLMRVWRSIGGNV